MSFYGYRLVHKDAMREDSWTYGDWRQYICCINGPHGFTQCGRPSNFPFFCGVASLCLFCLAGMGLWIGLQEPLAVRWEGVIGLFAAACLVGFPQFFQWDGPWRLMVMVGPPNEGTRRVLPGEEKSA